MALTVQNIVDDVSYETRLLLDGTGGSGTAFNLIVRWVDQMHKDALHTSLYFHHLRKEEDVTTTAGTRSYSLSGTDVARIEHVYDKTFDRELLPYDMIFRPAAGSDPSSPGAPFPEPKAILSSKTQSPWPEFYQLQTVVTTGTNAHTLYVFPAPSNSARAGVLEVHYVKEVPTVSAAGDKLMIPDDGRDLIVSGVMIRASNYLKRPEESVRWTQAYDLLKRGERSGIQG